MRKRSKMSLAPKLAMTPNPIHFPSKGRQAARGRVLNAPEVKYLWAVFQRRPLTALPWWKQWLARRVYWVLDWQTADGEEKQAICTTEAVAKAICAAGGPNWFYHRLPVDVSLPAETCKLGGVRFPQS